MMGNCFEGGRPPEDEAGESLGHLIRDTHRAFTRALQARIEPLGINIGMWFFLRALWNEEGISQRELSQRVRRMEPTAVAALRSMERRGLVTRRRDSADRRIVRVFLTEEGRTIKDRLMGHAAALNLVARRG